MIKMVIVATPFGGRNGGAICVFCKLLRLSFAVVASLVFIAFFQKQ